MFIKGRLYNHLDDQYSEILEPPLAILFQGSLEYNKMNVF